MNKTRGLSVAGLAAIALVHCGKATPGEEVSNPVDAAVDAAQDHQVLHDVGSEDAAAPEADADSEAEATADAFDAGWDSPFLPTCAAPDPDAGSAPPLWSKAWGNLGGDYAHAVALGPSGDLIVYGDITGAVDFGAGPIGSGKSAFVQRLTPSGEVVWVTLGASTDFLDPRCIAADATGGSVVGGSFMGSLDWEGVVLQSPATEISPFVVRLDPNGKPLWGKAFAVGSALSGGEVSGAGIGPKGDLFLAGGYSTWIDIGTGPLPVPDTGVKGGAFFARFGLDGTPVWGQAIPGLVIRSIIINSTNHLVIGGAAGQGTDLGNGPIAHDSLVVAVYSEDGSTTWAKAFPTLISHIGAVSTDGGGNVYVGGEIIQPVDFGSGPVSGEAGFLLKMAPDGSTAWLDVFPCTGPSLNRCSVRAVAVDSSGKRVIVSGSFGHTYNLGGQDLLSNDAVHDEAYVAAFDESGHHVWSRSFGGQDDDSAYGAILDPSCNAIVVGFFDGDMNMGNWAVKGYGGRDAFAIKFAP